MADTAPVGVQVILGGGKVPVPGKRGGHWRAGCKESDKTEKKTTAQQ